MEIAEADLTCVNPGAARAICTVNRLCLTLGGGTTPDEHGVQVAEYHRAACVE